MTSSDSPKEGEVVPADSNVDSFICVFCETPTTCLYRQYTSSPSSIKLTVCQTCGNDVDPYIEREWLLVVLDCILLRLPAYRHVLFHRLNASNICARKMIQTLLASSILSSYLTWEAWRTTSDKVEVSFNQLLMNSILNNVVFWMSSSLFTRRNNMRQVFCALFFPTAFQVVTVLVLVWENTATVRILGSLFVLVFQATAIKTVTKQSWWLVVPATMVRALVGRLFAIYVMEWPWQPCAGVEWNVRGDERYCLS